MKIYKLLHRQCTVSFSSSIVCFTTSEHGFLLTLHEQFTHTTALQPVQLCTIYSHLHCSCHTATQWPSHTCSASLPATHTHVQTHRVTARTVTPTWLLVKDHRDTVSSFTFCKEWRYTTNTVHSLTVPLLNSPCPLWLFPNCTGRSQTDS